ncbi:MAG: cytochrome c [Saccharospirillaceae bacterium]|nr:cytochrome c [Pseudomonadales bacterium]NRB81004.1 cytochrome c [Saccharospirillaceae bacterium]
MKSIFMLIVCLMASLFSHAATDEEKALRFRQSVMNVVGYSAGNMGAMVKGKMDYDQAEFLRHAINLNAMLRLAQDAFVEGSNVGDSKAKDIIWTQRGKFDQKLEDAQLAAQELINTLNNADKSMVFEQFSDLGKTCKGCHKTYRKR